MRDSSGKKMGQVRLTTRTTWLCAAPEQWVVDWKENGTSMPWLHVAMQLSNDEHTRRTRTRDPSFTQAPVH